MLLMKQTAEQSHEESEIKDLEAEFQDLSQGGETGDEVLMVGERLMDKVACLQPADRV